MFSDLSFLDYFWKALVILSSSSALILILSYLLEKLFISQSIGKDKRNFYNILSVILFLIIIFSFSIINSDPEIISSCFTQFANTSDSFTITRALSLLYLGVLLILITFDVVKTSIALYNFRGLQPLNDIAINEHLLVAAKKLRIKKSIKIYLSENELSPFVYGFFKYKLCLTKNILNLEDKEKFEAIILHELAHIKGCDSIWLTLAHFYKRFLFFIPMVYFSNNKHLLAIEIAADELAVVEGKVRAKKLIESLIEFAVIKSATQTTLQLNASRGYKNLHQRILSVGTLNQKVRLDWKFKIFASIFLLTSAAIAIAQAAPIALIKYKNDNKLMCSQIQHEKIIETWLQIQPSPKRCE